MRVRSPCSHQFENEHGAMLIPSGSRTRCRSLESSPLPPTRAMARDADGTKLARIRSRACGVKPELWHMSLLAVIILAKAEIISVFTVLDHASGTRPIPIREAQNGEGVTLPAFPSPRRSRAGRASGKDQHDECHAGRLRVPPPLEVSVHDVARLRHPRPPGHAGSRRNRLSRGSGRRVAPLCGSSQHATGTRSWMRGST
jgi:hypothetical protein